MLLAIFIVPILYFINAFLIGRFIKFFKISANPFLCTILGFFGFFNICYFFDIFLYCANANIWSYIIFYSIIQAILLIAYAINWKKIFITFTVDWRKIVTFILTFAMVVIISWLCLRDFNSEFGQSWIRTISNLPQTNLNNIISFRINQNDVISNFSSFNIFNIFWINCFNINSSTDCLNFCNWSWIICAAGIVACLATWLIPEKSSYAKLIISPIICLAYVVVLLAFIESFAIGDAWIALLVMIYILVLIKHEPNANLKLAFLTVLLFAMLAAGSTSFYVVICIWLFSIYWAIRNKQDSVKYLVILSWPLILVIFGFASIGAFWLFALGDVVCIIVMIVLSILLIRKGMPVWTTKFARAIARNSGKIVYTFIGLLIAAILVANFFIFAEIYKWNGANINYKNFLTFTYTYIWSFNILNDTNTAIINAVLYGFFIALIVAFIVIRNVKTSKLYPIAKNDIAIKLAVSSAVIFINPLVIHVLKLSMSTLDISFPLNTLDLNILFAAPLFVALLGLNYNLKLRSTKYWAYDWY